MEKILKHKVLQLYLNKISLENFENDLYNFVEKQTLIKGTFFYELVILNYRDKDYRKKLFDLLTFYSSEEEILALKLYQNCKSIIDSDSQKEILNIIDLLGVLCYETEYIYGALFRFYRLSDRISIKHEGYYYISSKEVVQQAKYFSKVIIEKYEEFKIDEDWNAFLKNLPDETISSKKEKTIEQKVVPINTKKWYEFWK
jgi:hypothetical protein